MNVTTKIAIALAISASVVGTANAQGKIYGAPTKPAPAYTGTPALPAEEKAAFITELRGYTEHQALAPLKMRLLKVSCSKSNSIYVWDTPAKLRQAVIKRSDGSTTAGITDDVAGLYIPQYGKYPASLSFVYSIMAQGTPDWRQRVVAHELMHAADFELFNKVSNSSQFKKAFKADKEYVESVMDGVSEEDRRENKDILSAYEHFLSIPSRGLGGSWGAPHVPAVERR